MVSAHINQTDTNLMRRHITQIIDKTGGNFTLYTRTATIGPMGDVTGVTNSSATIRGIITYLTQKDINLIGPGYAQKGDAKFFTTYDVSINDEDWIESSSGEQWEFVETINSPEIDGNVVH